MTIHNLFNGGEGGVATSFGPDAWAMYPRPDILPEREYKGPGQYGGIVTRRIAASSPAGYVSDGGHDATMRYIMSHAIADADRFRLIIIPRHWLLISVLVQVYRSTHSSGLQTGVAHTVPVGAVSDTGWTGDFDVVIETVPSSIALAPEVSLATGIDCSKDIYRYITVPSDAQLSTVNRYLAIDWGAVPDNLRDMNFELTVDMKNIRDVGRPT